MQDFCYSVQGFLQATINLLGIVICRKFKNAENVKIWLILQKEGIRVNEVSLLIIPIKCVKSAAYFTTRLICSGWKQRRIIDCTISVTSSACRFDNQWELFINSSHRCCEGQELILGETIS